MRKYAPLAVLFAFVFLLSRSGKTPELAEFFQKINSAIGSMNSEAGVEIESKSDPWPTTEGPTTFTDQDRGARGAETSGGNYIVNPIVKNLLEKDSLGIDESADQGMAGLERINEHAGKYLYMAAAGIFGFMLLTCKTNLSWMGLSLARAGYGLSSLMIFAAIAAVPLGWFAGGYNCLEKLGSLLVEGPTAVLIASAASLKLYDFNQPIWNRLIAACGGLLVSIGSLRAF